MKTTRRFYLVAALATVLATLSLVALAWRAFPPLPGAILWPNALAAEGKRRAPVIGQLGGVPVMIPREFARFVEYDDDPQWMTSRKGSPPERSFDSGLRSFGFKIRFPDMKGLTEETAEEKKSQSIFTTTWMRVGVKSNSFYGSSGDTALEAHINNIPLTEGRPFRYERIPGVVDGLVGYTPLGVDLERRGIVGRADMRDKNIYFHRNPKGEADAYIECSNVLHASAPCELRFNLLPTLRAHVSVGFRRELLPHWQQIRSSVAAVILGFRANPATGNTSFKQGE
jgi:hypothetical protein